MEERATGHRAARLLVAAVVTVVSLLVLTSATAAQSPDPPPEYPIPTPEPTPDAPGFDLPDEPPPVVEPRMIDPFPRVRVRGYLTERGARLTLVRVKAPPAVRIVARCWGRSCPRRKLVHMTAVTRLRAFERRLRAGTRLVFKVTRPDAIGKYTKVRIRRGAIPRRHDRCLYPGERTPRACPAA